MNTSLAPSQWTLLSSAVLYPLGFYSITPTSASPSRFAKSREAVSVFHCTLMTALALVELRRRWPDWGQPSSDRRHMRDSELPLISTRSEFGNCITAIETAYLAQDSVVLMYAAALQKDARARGLPLKALNIRPLAWHHAGLLTAFGVLQWYIAQGRERGIGIIVMMILMNAS